MREIACPIIGLDEIGIGSVLKPPRAYTAGANELCCVWTQVDHGTPLIHIQTETHPRIDIPKLLPIGTKKDILPEGALGTRIRPVFTIEVSKFTQCDIH